MTDSIEQDEEVLKQKILDVLGYKAAHRVAIVHVQPAEDGMMLSIMCSYNTNTSDPLEIRQEHPSKILRTEEVRTRMIESDPDAEAVWTVQSVIHRLLTPTEIAGIQALHNTITH